MKTVCIAAGLAALAIGAASPAFAQARDLEGHWRTNRDDSGLTDLDIRFQGYTFDVHASGLCGRQDCDFGQSTGTAVVSPGGRDATDAIGFTTAFEANDATRQVFVITTGRDRLQVITILVPRGGGRPAVWTTDNFQRDDRGPPPPPPPPPGGDPYRN